MSLYEINILIILDIRFKILKSRVTIIKLISTTEVSRGRATPDTITKFPQIINSPGISVYINCILSYNLQALNLQTLINTNMNKFTLSSTEMVKCNSEFFVANLSNSKVCDFL